MMAEFTGKRSKYIDSYRGEVPEGGIAWFLNVLGEEGYRRSIYAFVVEAQCDGCHETKHCLHTDASTMEFSPVALCMQCVFHMFEETGEPDRLIALVRKAMYEPDPSEA